MQEYVLGTMEMRFAKLIWNYAPITTGELIKLCEKEFDWKRTTTYTMLKRLCQRNIFKMEDSIVTVLISEDAFHGKQSEQFVEETFGGSLPSFIAAFTNGKTLSKEDADEIQRLINMSRERSSHGNDRSL